MRKTFEAFKYRVYRLLWIGNLCMTIAVWIQTTTTCWIAYSLTGTDSTIGVVNAMRMIPTPVMTPIAGVASIVSTEIKSSHDSRSGLSDCKSNDWYSLQNPQIESSVGGI